MNTETETEPLEEAETPICDRYHIADRAGVEWFLRKLAAKESERALIAEQAARMLAALDADIAGLRGLYEAEAIDVARGELDPDGTGAWKQGKTFNTFHGSVSFRTVPGGLRRATSDDAQTADALARAQQIGATVTTIDSERYLQAAQEALEATGELFPGCERYDARESVSVKFGDGKAAAKATRPKKPKL